MTDQEFYLVIGARCLRFLLQWPEQAISDWERQHKAVFTDDYFTTELPFYYIDMYFVPRPRIVDMPRSKKQGIQVALRRALTQWLPLMLDDLLDWAPIRTQVDDLLKSFGTSLQVVIDDNAAWIAEGMPFSDASRSA